MTEPATATRESTLRVSRLLAALAVTPLLRSLIIQHSVPSAEPWRTECPHCAAPVGLLRAPTLQPFLPAARCGSCGERVGPPPYSVELVTLVVAAALAVSVPPLELPAYAWWAGCAIALSFVDAAVHRLPDRLTMPAAGGFVLFIAPVALLDDRLGGLLRAVLAGAGLALALAIVAFISKSWLGFGDVKYGLAIGAATGWLGWFALLAGLFFASFAAAMYGIGLIIARKATLKTHIPQGPFLAVGALLVVLMVGLGS
jgi:leader peptidase (prepilin peptidase)/N-methyltransferase